MQYLTEAITDRLRKLCECLRGVEEKVINQAWGQVFGDDSTFVVSPQERLIGT